MSLLELVRAVLGARRGANGYVDNVEASMTNLTHERAVLHTRVDGRSLAIPLTDLDVGPRSDDRDIKRVVADHLKVPVESLRDYVVDRHESGNLTLRPQAVFG